jgi:hypothetical protein
MQITNPIGLKEWAVIIQALTGGRQIIILRKGGVAEEQGRFLAEHREFFLFPTYTHQQEQGVKETAHSLLKGLPAPRDGYIELRSYAVVNFVTRLTEWEEVAALEPFHIWSAQEIRERFDRREPDLTLLALRVYRLNRVIPVADEPRFAGCRSWVTLEQSILTDGAVPALSEKKYLEKLNLVKRALAGARA